MPCLFAGYIQPLAEYPPVTAGLIQQIDEIAVLKDVFNFGRGQQILDILGDARGNAAPFTEPLPDFHTPCSHLAPEQQVEFVNEIPGGFTDIPVLGNPVPYLILNNQHSQIFELLAQLLDIEAYQPVVDIHIGAVVEHIQGAVDIQF